MENETPAVLSLGDEVSAGITVRGPGLTDAQAISMAKPSLDEWQGQQIGRLPEGCHFQSSDRVLPPVSRQYSASRTLKVVRDEDA
ncbi:hypothetical protein LH464_21325 [Neorhizobium sp. T786]|uniref:hypothetical protein n=1 Tax=Pseudorhizobium xiangyangii TaxID=2883104 RepID=UPI001CFF5E05|nr:hypothetical protein [Neorhizobium xiangyangii]MCB5205011.1 hypothetical protein [Neorhizobium xiangyangii]